ncbi:MAG: DUF922 domain-containing protein [Dehalococcoidales bacterium]|nr:DUF922 domain-containing protein [Dehalococcoidales bacterium]
MKLLAVLSVVLSLVLAGCGAAGQTRAATATPAAAAGAGTPAATAPRPPATTEAPSSTPRPASIQTATVAAPRSSTPTTISKTPSLDSTSVGLISIPNATVVYYDIAGSTERELRAQLDALGPVDQSGWLGDAYTGWNISWRWPAYANGSCQLANVKVTYEIKVTFPRWIPPRNASPEMVARWETYTRALAEHEKGHVDFVVQTIPSVAEAIKKATCNTANAAAEKVLDRIRQHDVEYDAATKHGATQGARFP